MNFYTQEISRKNIHVRLILTLSISFSWRAVWPRLKEPCGFRFLPPFSLPHLEICGAPSQTAASEKQDFTAAVESQEMIRFMSNEGRGRRKQITELWPQILQESKLSFSGRLDPRASVQRQTSHDKWVQARSSICTSLFELNNNRDESAMPLIEPSTPTQHGHGKDGAFKCTKSRIIWVFWRSSKGFLPSEGFHLRWHRLTALTHTSCYRVESKL